MMYMGGKTSCLHRIFCPIISGQPNNVPKSQEGKVNSEEGISKNPERESVRDFRVVRMEGVT